MLHRPEAEGLVVISQPAHAWVSAQLAAAWGGTVAGDRIGEELRLAVEHHDDGWSDWEAEPELNPETGRPHSYLDLPTETHIRIFEVGVERALTLGRYPALIVSRHATGLVRRYHRPGSDADRRIAGEFLDRQDRIQDRLRRSLAAGPEPPFAVDDGSLDRVGELVSTWDALSLKLCAGLETADVVEGVPLASGVAGLSLAPRSPGEVDVDPWPFRESAVDLDFEGRRLGEGFRDPEAMRRAFRSAPWVRYRVRLAPGR